MKFPIYVVKSLYNLSSCPLNTGGVSGGVDIKLLSEQIPGWAGEVFSFDYAWNY